MERYLVIWCPKLSEPAEHGREKRAFELLVERVSTLATRVETVRPGVCAVPTRGPSRYFGGDVSLAGRVAAVLPDAKGARIGVADGLFAAVLASRSGDSPLVVPPCGTPAFLAPWPVSVLGRFDLADLLGRLGIRTLGQFAALSARDVLARFGTEGVACHRAASGSTGELPGLRIAGPPEAPVAGVRQPGFWGGTAEADLRARAVLSRIQQDLGAEEVLVGRLQGGRYPSERAKFVPADGTVVTARPDGPWPGRLPAPSPAVVPVRRPRVDVVDQAGTPVTVSSRIVLSSRPARVSVAGGPWEEVAAWAGPWPTDDLWWSEDHTRRARMQVLTVSGAARLLASEAGSWWLEGNYD